MSPPRGARAALDEAVDSRCALTGEERSALERRGVDFDAHVTTVRNPTHYVLYLLHLRRKAAARLQLSSRELAVLRAADALDGAWLPDASAHVAEDRERAALRAHIGDAASAMQARHAAAITRTQQQLQHGGGGWCSV